MVHFKPVKVTIDTLGLAKEIINVVMQYYDLLNSIINDCRMLFTSNFWFLLHYFPSIKQ